jgi:hypothetical protein
MLEEIHKMYLRVQELKTFKTVVGNIKIALNFDRTNPTVIISDGQQKIELRPEEFDALKKYVIDN